MFTGLIEEVGVIRSNTPSAKGRTLTIAAPGMARELALGESVNVNGACQTLTQTGLTVFSVEATGDTLTKTTLASLGPGRQVNLERALQLGERLDGHMVQGHVNGVGKVIRWEEVREGLYLHLSTPLEFSPALVPEGSVTVDGVSLTIAEVLGDRGIRISVIPHTRSHTTFRTLKAGDLVNLETDILLRSFLKRSGNREELHADSSSLTLEKLQTWGYS